MMTTNHATNRALYSNPKPGSQLKKGSDPLRPPNLSMLQRGLQRVRPLFQLAARTQLTIVTFAALIGLTSASVIEVNAQEKTMPDATSIKLPRPRSQDIRDWIKKLPQAGRKEAIAAFYEQIGKPYLNKTRHQPTYRPPAMKDADTREFVFKKGPGTRPEAVR
jgi:hypothetical protein